REPEQERPRPRRQHPDEADEAFRRDAGLDAEPADQRDADRDADHRATALTEPGPAGEHRGLQALAAADDPDADRHQLEDHGAEREGEEGVPEAHAEPEGGAQQELAE